MSNSIFSIAQYILNLNIDDRIRFGIESLAGEMQNGILLKL